VVGLQIGLAGCVSAPSETPEARRARLACEVLAEPVAASDIVLPSRGAEIELTRIDHTAAGAPYCSVRGRVLPLDPAAPALPFELDLPLSWSGRAVQLGDGGLAWPRPAPAASGLAARPDALPAAPLDAQTPLQRGDVSYGLAEPQSSLRPLDWSAVAARPDALRDLAYGAQKKLRDVAGVLIRRFHGEPPARVYYLGQGEAGRQGLALAQRYPADFDGIFSLVPSVRWTAQQHAALRDMLTLAEPSGGAPGREDGRQAGKAGDPVGSRGEGWLRPAQVAWLAQAVRARCDALDGLADGVVANVLACDAAFDPASLRCPDGRPAGDRCLSDAQLRAVQTRHAPYRLAVALAHGANELPGRFWGGEDLPPAGEAGGWLAWWTGLAPPRLPVRAGHGLAWEQVVSLVPPLFAQQAPAELRSYQPGLVAGRVREVAAVMDASDPNLARFAALGGKLVLMEHLADPSRSPAGTLAYADAVTARLGATAADRFMRLYAVPGADHLGEGAPSRIDMLEVLVDWVERAKPPGPLEVVRQDPAPPHAVQAARPLCRWPAYPHYRGHGDVRVAAHFECRRP
jgi:hypothetical protein